jgi:multiple sugar transport system permease protein
MLFLYVAVVAIVFVKVLGADITGAKELKLLSKKSAKKSRTLASSEQKKAEATR